MQGVSNAGRINWLLGAGVLIACGTALTLSLAHLSRPDLWHDELVHVFVAKHIAAHGTPALPSGVFYPSSMAYNYLLGGAVALLGDGSFAVRAPSALLHALNVLLLFLLTRRLFGNSVALVAAFALAASPWSVAWARQARMYTLQSTAYLLLLWWAWEALQAEHGRRAAWAALLAILAYWAGVFSSYHSILALGSVGAFLCLAAAGERAGLYPAEPRRRHYAIGLLACVALGVMTVAGLFLNPNPTDQAAVFQTGLGGRLPDPQRLVRWYYLRWLSENLSLGFLLAALLGTALLLFKEKQRGLYMALAFWAPVLVLTFLIGYRRERFMFFCFPCYVALFSYALVQMARFMTQFRRSAGHAVLGAAILLFGMRLALSAEKLTLDAVHVARGDNTTLAVKHQQWRKPCEYVKQHWSGETVLATMALPVMYYLGHIDNWFPNRYTRWEYQESGLPGLGSLDELQAFILEHPKGYYLADEERFEKWRGHGDLPDLGREVAWVEANMTRIDEGSSDDVALFSWGMPPPAAPPSQGRQGH